LDSLSFEKRLQLARSRTETVEARRMRLVSG
jgi:hypothetical protein